LHLLVLLSVDRIVKLVDKEVITLFLRLLLLFESLEILLSLLHPLLSYQVKGGWHLFRYFWSLNLTHCLTHLLFIRCLYPYNLVGCGNLSLTYLMGILNIESSLEVILVFVNQIEVYIV
jgi:hypothetical protein